MILLWLGCFALLQSCVTLLPADWFPGAAWVETLLFAAFSVAFVRAATLMRRVPVFGIQGQWLILPAVLMLFLTQGGLPGEPGSIGQLLDLPDTLLRVLTLASQIVLVVGLWQALSNLAHKRLDEPPPHDPSLHAAQTIMVMPPSIRRQKPAETAMQRTLLSGLSATLRDLLRQLDDSHRILRDQILQAPTDVAARLALHRRLMEDPRYIPATLAHAKEFISALLEITREDLALALATDCARLNHDYFPPNDEALRLARHALVFNQPAMALRLLRHYDVRNPGDASVPQALMYCAQALASMDRIATAKSLLAVIMERWPDHPLAAEAVAVSARLATRAH